MLLPFERMPRTGAPAMQRYGGSCFGPCGPDERPVGNDWSRPVLRNRERELGLDRRETG